MRYIIIDMNVQAAFLYTSDGADLKVQHVYFDTIKLGKYMYLLSMERGA